MNVNPVTSNNYNTNSYNKTSNGPSFQSLPERYGKWVLKGKGFRKFAKRLYELDTTNATKHFAVFGAFITSAAYAYNTMKNNKLEKKNSTTLAINQTLGWIVPTTLGYLVDAGIAERTKQVEYDFAALLTKKMKLTKGFKVDHDALDTVTKQIKGVRTLASIATFTLLYRYLAPVAITPAANHIGDWVGKKVDEKNKRLAKEAEVQLAIA